MSRKSKNTLTQASKQVSKKNKINLRVALVHDFLREYGGAERVLEMLHEMYPEAPVYVGFVDWRALGAHASRFRSWDIRTTWMQRLPFIKQLFSPLRIFAPSAFRSLDLSQYDLVISSSNAYFAKAVRAPNGMHLCYCHTPPRALYGYSTRGSWRSHWWTRFFGSLINNYLRVVDFHMAQDVDLFLANSAETQRRIWKFYRRQSVILHPPVALMKKIVDNENGKSKKTLNEKTSSKTSSSKGRKNDWYYLYVNRLGLAKHPELAVAAATKLKVPLKVVGTGPMLADLKKQAGPTVEFLGALTDSDLIDLYQGARALLYPVEDEDFGIVPIEAMSAGVPVIAHRSGGPMETIEEGKSGIFFSELTTAGLVKAMRAFEKSKWDKAIIQKAARQYSPERFISRLKNIIQETEALKS